MLYNFIIETYIVFTNHLENVFCVFIIECHLLQKYMVFALFTMGVTYGENKIKHQ